MGIKKNPIKTENKGVINCPTTINSLCMDKGKHKNP